MRGRRVEKLTDAELQRFMDEMSRTPGAYAAKQHRFALEEAIKREQVSL